MHNAKILDQETDYGILAAQIAGAFGIGGGIRLRLIGSQPEVAARSLRSARKIRMSRVEDGFQRDLTLTSLRRQGQAKGAWLATFHEISSRTEAELLNGCGVYVPEGLRPALPDGEFYVDQLIGLSVITDSQKNLGQVREILNTPANDVYVTDKDILIPAVAAFILQVNLEDKVITVHDMPGLADDL